MSGMKKTLGPCRACGQDVSKTAKACPHCGEKQPAGPKQYGCGMLILLFVGFLVIYTIYGLITR